MSFMRHWEACGRAILADRAPRVMGVVNVTPDSFSEGGRAGTRDQAVARAERLIAEASALEVLNIPTSTRTPTSSAAVTRGM